MPMLERFSREMIQAAIEDSEFSYMTDRDGDFVVEFGYDEEINGHPRFLLMLSGENEDQYCLRADTMSRVRRDQFDRTIRLCNEWNALYKQPKVYFEVDDPNNSTSGRVVCELWINLAPGAHQELVNHFTSGFFAACFGFWHWLSRQNDYESLGDVPPQTPRVPKDDK